MLIDEILRRSGTAGKRISSEEINFSTLCEALPEARKIAADILELYEAANRRFVDVHNYLLVAVPDGREMIVDATCMKLVMDPQQFDVIVTTNLFGDIISDLCAGLVGGLGLAPGANIGKEAAIFEAVHGSAPDIAGRKIANPCALLLAAAQMLTHLDMADRAERLRAAIAETIRAGDRTTPDLGGSGNTDQFADAIIERL